MEASVKLGSPDAPALPLADPLDFIAELTQPLPQPRMHPPHAPDHASQPNRRS
jgi:hypothetical protein